MQKTPVWQTKAVHNWAKEVLIQTNVKPGDRVLDLGCARGLDAGKWDRARVGQYVAVDPSQDVLNEAESRWKLKGPSVPPHEFFACDLCVSSSLLQQKQLAPFDVVCCMDLAPSVLQRAFDHPGEDKLARLLKTVSESLKPGGRFIGVAPDSSELWYKVAGSSSSELTTQGGLFSASFVQDGFGLHFGSRYTWTLLGDEPCQGALVHWPSLTRCARSMGLRTLDVLNMREFLDDFRGTFGESLRSQLAGTKLAPEQAAVVNLFAVFFFEKSEQRDSCASGWW